MIDVDFHADMPRLLTLLPPDAPVLMYTVLPANVPERGRSHVTYFNGNRMVWECNGGYRAEHKIWDYGPDLLTVRRNGLALRSTKY
jgi:hypothetical protein